MRRSRRIHTYLRWPCFTDDYLLLRSSDWETRRSLRLPECYTAFIASPEANYFLRFYLHETASLILTSTFLWAHFAFVTSSLVYQTHQISKLAPSYASSMGRSVSRQRVIVRQSYYWPDQQLNFWIIIMLATGGVLIGVFATFINIQQTLGGLGIPW